MKTETNNRQVEFGRLSTGSKFFLVNPDATDDKSVYIKIQSFKDARGTWSNAKNIYGFTTFVQYDKRVWTKSEC